MGGIRNVHATPPSGIVRRIANLCSWQRPCFAARAGGNACFAQTDAPVRIGFSIARTGPNAVAAQGSVEANYTLWSEQVNAAGGLNVKGQKRKIELIGYDDQSDVETSVRTYEKLMADDKVDLILPPWGSNFAFAVGPLANKYGYPFLSTTGSPKKLLDMKMPYFFGASWTSEQSTRALVDLMAAQHVKTVAIGYMDDLFGLERYNLMLPMLKEHGITVVGEKSFPANTKDLSVVLKDFKAKEPDALVGLTYPAESFLMTTQTKEIGFNPKLFYVAIGPAFPFFKQRFGDAADGMVGFGTWSSERRPDAAELSRRIHEALQQGARPRHHRLCLVQPAGFAGGGRKTPASIARRSATTSPRTNFPRCSERYPTRTARLHATAARSANGKTATTN